MQHQSRSGDSWRRAFTALKWSNVEQRDKLGVLIYPEEMLSYSMPHDKHLLLLCFIYPQIINNYVK